jgi:VWFA-related protein
MNTASRSAMWSSVLVGGVALGAFALVRAQQTPPPQPASQGPAAFKAGVDLVRLDVSVLDKNRRPVHGLAAADFTIREDGNPQHVDAFLAVDLPDPPVVPEVHGKQVTWLRDVAPDVQTNDLAEGRLFVMFVDDALIPPDPKILANVKQVAKSIIDRLGPADRLSIAFSQDGRTAQGFTADRTRLLAAVDRMQAGRATYTFGWETIRARNSFSCEHAEPDRFVNPRPISDPDSGARDASVRSLQMTADALLSAPERRKALIYLSPGVPVNASLAANVTLANGRTQFGREANARLAGLLPDLFRELQRANVVVYSVDPTGPNGIAPFVARTMAGIRVLEDYRRDIVQPETQEARVSEQCDNAYNGRPCSIPQCFVPLADDFGHLIGRLNLDFLQTVAGNTGGRAIIGTENFEPGIEQIFVENGSYYLLGYKAPAGDKPGTMHRLKVTVNRPGLDVRTRSAYYTAEPDKVDPKHPDVSPTTKANSGPLAVSDLPLQVGLAPMAIPGKDEAAVTIVLGLQRAASSKPIADTVHVETRAFTPDGERRGIQLQDAFIAIRPSTTDENVTYEALSSINLKPGRYQLRIAAYSAMNDAAGSVYADVEVPDFTKAPVSLSGVLISATPVDVLAKIVPVVPTAARVFQKLHQVSAFVRAYQGAPRSGSGATPLGPATLTVRLTNERGDRLVDKSEALAADRFSGPARSVDYRFAIPMVTLARGPYLLTFEVSLGAASARRDIRFSVR